MRALATSLGILAALLAVPAGARANDHIRVEPEGSSPRTVTLSALGDPVVQGREYETGSGRAALTGWSLDRVLDAANVNPYRFGDVEIAAAGTSVTLDRDEFLDPGAFPDGPPVFWMQDGVSRFLRPASASGGASQVGGGGPITVRLSRPSRLSVSAAASKTRLDPGERVTFTARVEGAPVGEPVTVSWYFDDQGDRVRGARVMHRFRKPGTYDVTVSATTADDDPGADDFVTVRVGPEPDGPDRKGGGTNPDASAPDSGVGTGKAGPGSGGPSDGSAGMGDGEARDGEAGDSEAGDSSAAADEAAAARRSAARRRAQARRRAETRRERPDEEREPSAAEPDRSEQVTGIELADLSALSSQAGRDALRAARTGRLRDEEDEQGSGIPPVVWWTLGTAALLGLGGWREARNGPARRPA
jgi:PKD domain-containing protein